MLIKSVSISSSLPPTAFFHVSPQGECQVNEDCPDHRACSNNQCINPCQNQCGANAECESRRHVAVCKCPHGYSGDALVSCSRQSRSYPVARYYWAAPCLVLFSFLSSKGFVFESFAFMPWREQKNGQQRILINVRCKTPRLSNISFGHCGDYSDSTHTHTHCQNCKSLKSVFAIFAKLSNKVFL